MAKDDPEELSLKEQEFVKLYVIHKGNGSRAAREAGFGKTDGSSRVAANKLLTKPNIRDAIERAAKPKMKRLEISKERVLRELARIGYSRMDRLAKWKGERLDFHDSDALTPDDLAAVQQVSRTDTKDGGSFSIKLHDKMTALKVLGKYTGVDFGDDEGDDDEAGQKGAGGGKKTRSAAVDRLLGDAEESEEDGGA